MQICSISECLIMQAYHLMVIFCVYTVWRFCIKHDHDISSFLHNYFKESCDGEIRLHSISKKDWKHWCITIVNGSIRNMTGFSPIYLVGFLLRIMSINKYRPDIFLDCVTIKLNMKPISREYGTRYLVCDWWACLSSVKVIICISESWFRCWYKLFVAIIQLKSALWGEKGYREQNYAAKWRTITEKRI